MTGKYELMTGARWIEVSDEAKDLIKKLLVVEPQLRLSADEILQQSAWVVCKGPGGEKESFCCDRVGW